MIARGVPALAMWLAGCSGQPATTNDQAGRPAAVVPSPSVANAPEAEHAAPAAPLAPDAVARTFLTAATTGDRAAALEQWEGDPAAAQATLAKLAAYGTAPRRIGKPADADAGMGQRYITVPFSLGRAAGSAVLHRVAEGIESDDPRAHAWRIRSIDLVDHQRTRR